MPSHAKSTTRSVPSLITLPPRVRVIGRADPLRRPIRDAQDEALDVVGGQRSAIQHWRNVRIADRNHDAYADRIEAYAVRLGCPVLLADIRELKRWDRIEDGLMVRVWHAFKEAADAGRRIILGLGRLLGGRP